MHNKVLIWEDAAKRGLFNHLSTLLYSVEMAIVLKKRLFFEEKLGANCVVCMATSACQGGPLACNTQWAKIGAAVPNSR